MTSPLTIALPDNAHPLVRKAATILTREIFERAEVRATIGNNAGTTIRLDVEPGFGKDGFRLESWNGTGVRIVGDTPLGLMHGVGKFLRTSGYGKRSFSPSAWRGTSVPECSLRGMYCAFNFNNWYAASRRDLFARYMEELALWGFNAVLLGVTLPDLLNPEKDRARIDDAREALAAVKEAGMGAGLLTCPNISRNPAPKGAEAQKFPDANPPRRGWVTPSVCPSHPEGYAYLEKMLDAYLAGYEDIGVDYIGSFPYDAGGCGCKDCWPWGARGFVTVSKLFSRLMKKRYPTAKFIVTTWCFDVLEKPDGEYEGLDRELRKDRSWADYVMVDSHFEFPEYPLKHGCPGGLPMVNFPEITMWGRYPWGGSGANPLPERFERIWRQAADKLDGGFPYSEGIYEDMNKAAISQFYWKKSSSAMETMREYVAYEFGAAAVEPVLEAIQLLEATYPSANCNGYESAASGGERRSTPEAIDRAYALLTGVDATLTNRAASSWRWRILYLRALIDYEKLHNNGAATERCNDAFEELERIYAAEGAGGPVSPKSRRTMARLTRLATPKPDSEIPGAIQPA